jgi:hypothetical protein
MTGYVVIGGKEYGRITATTRDSWAAEVAGRLHTLGLGWLVDRLSNHVELKAVMMLLKSRAREGEVTINNVPCGFGPGRRDGCHQVLGEVLPRGYSLTVLGTDAHGEPFKHVYKGRASQ